jgi:PBP1b-binding outer membrane lipoprotein LpoB
MKKTTILILIFTIVFLLTGCKGKDASKYAGIYKGTLMTADYTEKDVELVFTNKNTNKETLYLYDIALSRILKGQYNANEEIALKLINILNEDITFDVISNTSTTFVFEDNEVTMDMHYNIAGTANTFHIRYIGSK